MNDPARDQGGGPKAEAPKAEAPKAEAPKATTAQQFGAASDKLRETAKWLATTFGALGAALIASLSLSDLQGLTGGELVLAIGGFALGLIGTGIVIASVTQVLMTTTASVADIAGRSADPEATQLLRTHASILGGFENPEALGEEYTRAQRERIDSYTKMLRESDAKKTVDPADQHKYDRATKMLKLASPIVDRVLGYVAFDRIRRRFERALWGIGFGVVVAALGMGVFAFYSNSQGDEGQAGSVIVGQPVEARVDLTPEGTGALGEMLGSRCNLDAVPVLAVDATEDSVEVISLPSASCETHRFTITPDVGVVCPVDVAIKAALPRDPVEADSGGVLVC